jgi:hypothetical protein
MAIDLFCGLGGWADGFLAEGYTVIGFDIERHDYGTGIYPGQLILQDVLTLHGSQFRNATVIVASPPCQAYSYRAMPWKRAKALPPPDNSLFEACFRIQREACEAAGRYIPLIVENVRGAQKWVGRAGWHFGSYFLWGDIPALMPIARARKNTGGSWFAIANNTTSGHSQNPDGRKIPGFRFDGSGKSFQSESVKTVGHLNIRDGHSHTRHLTNQSEHTKVAGLDWSRHGELGYKAQGFNVTAAQRFREEFDNSGGVKGFTPTLGKNELGQKWGSKSDSRKAASAQIAKIPFPLAQHIAKVFKLEAKETQPEQGGREQ